MKSTGQIRRLSQTGQLTIPAEVRVALGIQPFDDVEIETDKAGNIVIRRVVPSCRFCGSSAANPVGPKSILVCDACLVAAAIMSGGGEPNG